MAKIHVLYQMPVSFWVLKDINNLILCDKNVMLYLLMSYMSVLLLVAIYFVNTRIEDPGETVLLV